MKQVCLVIFAVLALSHVPRTIADQSGAYPKRLSEWAASVPPKLNSVEGKQANYSYANWMVSMQQGQPSATLQVTKTGPDFLDVFSTHALSFQIKPSRDFSGLLSAAKVDDGWIVGFNRGEWGGSLWWFSPDGMKHYKVSGDRVDQLLMTDAGVLGLETLNPIIFPKRPDPKAGELLQLVKSASGIWQAVNYLYLPDPLDRAMQDADGSLIIVTFHELLRVDHKKQLEVLFADGFWGSLLLNITSILRDRFGTYYVGMRAGVARIRQRGKTYYADWLQPTKTFAQDNPALYGALVFL